MKVYDLTHFLRVGMTAYSEEESLKMGVLCNIEHDGYNVSELRLSTHTGTHIDVPRHMFKDGNTLDDYDGKYLIGSAYIIDCTKVKEINLEFIIKHEKSIRKAHYLILKTGWEKYFNKDKYLTSYPTLSYNASNFLGNIKSLRGVCVDCISIDGENDEKFLNHKNLLSKEKIIIENICNLDSIEDEFEIIISPMKIKNGDGAPVRIYGLLK